MSFPRYPDYKDSGVAWLGEVPGHWEVFSLKRDLAFLTSGSRGWAEHYADDGPLFIRIGNLTRGNLHLDLSDIQRVAVPDGTEGERTKIFAGDVLFSITAYLGSVAIAPEGLEAAYISQHVALARLRQKRFLPSWVGYTTLSVVGKTYLETKGYGGTKIQLGLDDIANLILTVPPLEEQSTIIAFLDGETAKIDALVVEQERLIELLKEKRQAVISHAVTKGLNPDAPMKGSGIEWLGEFPAHWNLKRIKHLIHSIEQGWSPQCESFPVDSDEQWGVLKVGCVNNSRFRPEENKSFPLDLDPIPGLGIFSGDLLISRANTRELVGSAAVSLADFPKLMLCDKLYRIRVNARWCLPAFLVDYLGTGKARGQIEVSATGASDSMVNIGQATILELAVAVPPIPEQIEILAYLKQTTAKLDSLVAEAQHVIDLLKERRAALISAAVTGQIDVRGLVADNHAPAERVPA